MIGYFGLGVANSTLNHILGDDTPYSLPTNYYIGLFTADTGLRTSDSGTWQEVSGGSYVRLQVEGASGLTFSSSTTGSSYNVQTWSWIKATADWGAITHIAILDAATVGNVVVYGELDSTVTIYEDDTFRFSIGDLEITL